LYTPVIETFGLTPVVDDPVGTLETPVAVAACTGGGVSAAGGVFGDSFGDMKSE